MNLVPILLLTIFFTSSRLVMSTSRLKTQHKKHITTQHLRLRPPYLVLADGQYVIESLAEGSDDDCRVQLLLEKWFSRGQHLSSCKGERVRGRVGERERERMREREGRRGKERKRRGRVIEREGG